MRLKSRNKLGDRGGRWHQFQRRVRSDVGNKDVFRDATYIVNNHLRHLHRVHGRVSLLDNAIDEQRRYAANSNNPGQLLALLLLLTPGAAQAQEQIDTHPHGFHSKQARVYELIDFNDAYVATVLAMQRRHLPTFNTHLKRMMDEVCRRVGTRVFDEQQFDAITRGLTREIAVYLTAVELGYDVRITSRREDAMGVDMVVKDKKTERTANLDIKSPSSYRYRLQDLVREGRMSEHDQMQADVKGYAFTTNGHGAEAVDVTLFRVDANEVGEIVDFRFEEPNKLDTRLQDVLREGLRSPRLA